MALEMKTRGGDGEWIGCYELTLNENSLNSDLAREFQPLL